MNDKNKIWDVSGDQIVCNSRTNESFKFDKVFGQEFTTDQIYEQNIKKHIESAITGINVTIFAYGQTSSGKTFTMRGTDGKPGLIPLTIQGIFNLTNDSQDSEVDYKITCSYLEIYNESVNDLLDSTKKNLDVRESISQGVYIQGLTNRE
jgi:centromeric protein E